MSQELNNDRMRWALEDIDRYADSLDTGAKTMKELSQLLLDIPGTETELKTSQAFEEVYTKIAEELRRLTSRGLNREGN